MACGIGKGLIELRISIDFTGKIDKMQNPMKMEYEPWNSFFRMTLLVRFITPKRNVYIMEMECDAGKGINVISVLLIPLDKFSIPKRNAEDNGDKI